MEDIKQILLFIQMLHYRDDLEELIFNKLDETKNKSISEDGFSKMFGTTVNRQLISNIKSILVSTGVITKDNNILQIQEDKLRDFSKSVKIAKASRDYSWPESKPQPYIYVSPSSIINSDLLGDVDDITNLIISLIRSTEVSVTLVSPFTNEQGLRAILAPLINVQFPISINIYLSSSEAEVPLIYAQIMRLLPQHLQKNVTAYFCVTNDQEFENLPHAKTIIVDSKIGYLGSANFTKQGLNTRFELGVKLDEKQCVAIEKMLKVLIEKEIYTKHASL
jgi:phosphatidylserine/phosphatidylglycerophosphate/cardiolipin synthase-like enzyme